MSDWLQRLETVRTALPEPGRLSALAFRHGTMSLRYYAPRSSDPQTPHAQDEIYVVAQGSGSIISGPSEAKLERKPFSRGDAIFVPAGYVHRFVDFSDDFGTWVIFWGPEGGERA